MPSFCLLIYLILHVSSAKTPSLGQRMKRRRPRLLWLPLALGLVDRFARPNFCIFLSKLVC
ncbi:hypothetical protein M419DRAFT_124141 [Trichoderma reesei RUT C-30]|uniref:Uncharacterized protein n=1 Tax=Hypocrea jecorina (strain ATCC 56765 / BCRC 32924 / NRRL 11460 / Rut C-30) TaxID=1344414 RepID=A0A024S6V3_HYPJR|nr:hypothetical protein M419DRAFT_124141 [Trichoderma reesei RUT C-30]